MHAWRTAFDIEIQSGQYFMKECNTTPEKVKYRIRFCIQFGAFERKIGFFIFRGRSAGVRLSPAVFLYLMRHVQFSVYSEAVANQAAGSNSTGLDNVNLNVIYRMLFLQG